jgi:hypothetical protein
MGRTLATPTLVTKSTREGPRDLPARRLVKAGRLQVSFVVTLADGRVRRGRSVTADVRAERVDDPDPHVPTVSPRDLPQDPIPTDDEMTAQLVEIAAASIVRELTPRREPALVTWEDAGGLDDEARHAFAQRDVRLAAQHLVALVGESGTAAAADASSREQRAALLYDLGLCEDLLGDHVRAERHLDLALALVNVELHQSALRDLRRRAELVGREERR